MMFNYSPFSYPNPYGYRQNRYYNARRNYGSNSIYNRNNFNGNVQKLSQDIAKDSTKEEIKKEPKKDESRSTDECFEIFGITLHFDDILLICLLFFLYNEGVEDQYLFISLVLLLLS